MVLYVAGRCLQDEDFSIVIMYNIQHTDTYIFIVSNSSSSKPPVLCRMIVEHCLG